MGALTESAAIFYDESLSLAEKQERLTVLADDGNEEARGYLGSIARIGRVKTHQAASDRSPRLAATRAMLAAVPESARTLEELPVPPVEADFERELVRCVQAHLPDEIEVKTQYPVALEGWPGVGAVDLALVPPNGAPVLCELKWGKGTLFNCAWDALKLATALAEGSTATGADLIAGAPRKDWERLEAGAELFEETDDYETELFLLRHRDGFAHWRKEVKTRPGIVPNHFSIDVAEDSRFALNIQGEPWEIRWATVMLTLTSGWLAIDENGKVSPTSGQGPPRMQWDR